MNNNERLLEVLGQIDDKFIESTAEIHRKENIIRIKRLSVAACAVLLSAAIIFMIRGYIIKNEPKGNENIIISTESGLTIPKKELNLSNNVTADMLGFFIYQGRSYLQYEWLDSLEGIAGEYLGTSNGLIDEWTRSDGYVEGAGSVGGDFYSIKGMNPEFMLCMKLDNGSCCTYINDNDITLKYGKDLFEDRLHLSENYTEIFCQTYSDWNENVNNYKKLEKGKAVENFISEIDNSLFMKTDDIPLYNGQQSYHEKCLYRLYFNLNNGMSVNLALYDGGYVTFTGIYGACVKIDAEIFNEIIKLCEN